MSFLRFLVFKNFFILFLLVRDDKKRFIWPFSPPFSKKGWWNQPVLTPKTLGSASEKRRHCCPIFVVSD